IETERLPVQARRCCDGATHERAVFIGARNVVGVPVARPPTDEIRGRLEAACSLIRRRGGEQQEQQSEPCSRGLPWVHPQNVFKGQYIPALTGRKQARLGLPA